MSVLDKVEKLAQQNAFTGNKILEDSWNNIASALAYKTTRPADTAKAIQEHLNVINKILANQKSASVLDKIEQFQKSASPLDFTEQYIDTALWASIDDEGQPLDANYDVPDLSPECKAKMEADCQSFQQHHAKLLEKAYATELPGTAHYSDGAAGHDFFLSRNGHGAGFWDRGLGKVGDELHTAAKAYSSFDLYVGDDGKIHCG